MSETIAEELTRKWIKITTRGDDDKADKIAKLEDETHAFDLQRLFCRAAECDGLFGVSHLYVDTGDTDDVPELQTVLIADRRKMKPGTLKAFRVVEPLWCYPNDYNSTDPLASNFYRPRTWFVQSKLLHSSRLITMASREVPDILKPAYMFGGLSLSQMAFPYVENWLRTRQSVADLLASFSVSGLKTNMDAILNGGDQSDLVRRAQLYNANRSNSGMMLIDKESEEFFNISTPLGGLDALQAQAQEQMASVAGIPLVKLLGITPSGLNASSDGEIRVFYDHIRAMQEKTFRPALERALALIQINTFGEIDPAITFEFEPLWQLDEAAMASVEKTKADTHAVYVDIGAVGPDDVRQAVAMDHAGPYHGLDLDGPAPGVETPDDAPSGAEHSLAEHDNVPENNAQGAGANGE
jgi:phage-related protein (TIGR01555 family)